MHYWLLVAICLEVVGFLVFIRHWLCVRLMFDLALVGTHCNIYEKFSKMYQNM